LLSSDSAAVINGGIASHTIPFVVFRHSDLTFGAENISNHSRNSDERFQYFATGLPLIFRIPALQRLGERRGP